MNSGTKISAAFFVFFLFAYFESEAQTVILSVDRGKDSIPSQRGPNLKKISHVFFNFGFVAGADKPGARIKYGSSVEYGIGVRKKYKISPVYSIGWELGFDGKFFHLDQQDGKILPDTTLNDAERMDYGSTTISFFNRFNLDPNRGNFMGTFLDLGVKGCWDWQIYHVIKNTLPDGSKVSSDISALPYVNHLNCEMFARVGRSHLSLYASYRLTNLFKSLYAFPELPVLMAGFELAIFRQ